MRWYSHMRHYCLITKFHCTGRQGTDMATMARWCVQRRAWVLIGWLALLALLAVLGGTGRAAGSTHSDALTLPGTGSTTAQNLLEQAFPGQPGTRTRSSGGLAQAA